MTVILIKNAVVYTPSGIYKNGWLCADGQFIQGMGAGDAPDFPDAHIIDANGLSLLPGFIDIHVHGAVGYEAMDAAPEGITCMAQFYARHGVTAFLPTTWTDSDERIQAALENIAQTLGAQPDGATVLGAHLEGPYLNPEKCGAQNTQSIRRAGREEALRYLNLNVIRLLAMAPEFPENHWLIAECARRGITVSAAHTAAGYDQMRDAIQRGVTHATHTFNAMIGLHHRDPGTVGAVLTAPQVMCELIADNIHVHPAVMQIMQAAKGADGLILVTDAIRGAGMPDGEYKIDGRTMIVKNGTARLPDGTLAGSTLTMNRALRNLIQASGKPLDELWKTASLNPARAIHVSARKGSLEVGKDADLVLVGDDIEVYLTIAEGKIVYQRNYS